MKSGGTSVSRMRFFSTAHWPTRPSPSADASRLSRCRLVRVAGEQPELGVVVAAGRDGRWCPAGL